MVLVKLTELDTKMLCKSTFKRTDVTAVSIHRSRLILAGVGSILYVYSDKNKLLLQRQCLNGQKIYGLIPNSSGDRYIIFGGKQFTLMNSSEDEGPPQFSRMFEPVVCEDWLHSALWAPQTDQIVLLTAHNVVLCYNIHTLSCSRYVSANNSILYSGLLVPVHKEILVLAGTVYSEVILHLWGEEKPLHQLKGHKGVIFSISCHPQKSVIVTTSDDRSVRIWGPKLPGMEWDSIAHWRNEIVCKYELYGHHARVMRSIINDINIISVGEDSHICFWSFEGVLLKRLRRHQNAGIWSIAANNQLLVTGGADGAVIAQYLSSDDSHESSTFSLDSRKPKQIAYTAKGNFFILLENNFFVYYDNGKNDVTYTHTLLNQNVTAYHSLSVSPCRKMCALAGRKANLQVAKEDEHSHIKFETVILENENVLSVHWASEDTVVACLENGLISVVTVTDTVLEACTMFELPPCKERWLTSAATYAGDTFVLGDRCGGLHMFRKGWKTPVRSFSKLHGRYGPTSLTILNEELITTGRDRMVKYFKITENNLINVGSFELDFHWVERFLDSKERLVCGFKEKLFVVHNVKQNEVILELECGGGHRSYDVLYTKENKNKRTLHLVYLKSSSIHTQTIQLDKHTTNAVISGSHSKEINCLKTLQVEGKTVFLTGGEDTTIRVSVLDGPVFEDIMFYKQLSSIRTLKICENQDDIIFIAAGGRAQICIKSITFKTGQSTVELETHDLVDYMIKGTDKQRKGDRNWKNVSLDIDPETRIMDVDYINHRGHFTIFTGCSDGCVRVFDFKPDLRTFEMIKESWYPHCILKTLCLHYLNQDWLVTGSTRGEVALWNVKHLSSDTFKPFFVTRANKSGINSMICRTIPDNKLLVATGGDDNALHLTVLQGGQDSLISLQVLHSLILDKYHSSAITGLCSIGTYIVSTSIDQRLSVFEWKVSDKIECNLVYQTFSDVADTKGIDVIGCDRLSLVTKSTNDAKKPLRAHQFQFACLEKDLKCLIYKFHRLNALLRENQG